MTAGLTTSVLAATAALNKGSDLVDQGRESVEGKLKVIDGELKALEKKFDKLEHHHKNLIRAGGLAIALSTGIDVITFL